MGTPGRQALTARLPVVKGGGCHPPSRQENPAFKRLSRHAERMEQRDEELLDAEARTGNLKACKREKPDTKGGILDGFIYGRPSKGKRPGGGKQTSGGCGVGGTGERWGSYRMGEGACQMPVLFLRRANGKYFCLCGLMQTLLSLCH